MAEYPQLEKEDIQAALAYGAEMARDRYVEIPTFIGAVSRAVSGNADENVHIRKAVGGRNWPYPGTSGK